MTPTRRELLGACSGVMLSAFAGCQNLIPYGSMQSSFIKARQVSDSTVEGDQSVQPIVFSDLTAPEQEQLGLPSRKVSGGRAMISLTAIPLIDSSHGSMTIGNQDQMMRSSNIMEHTMPSLSIKRTSIMPLFRHQCLNKIQSA